MKNEEPNCYKCIYRGAVPGSAHSSCKHPKKIGLNIKGNPVGISGGWFMWPWNFDPTWLVRCSGFTKKEEEK